MCDIEITCNAEIDNYFKCLGNNIDTDIHDKKCSPIINSYYKCLDNKKFTEFQLKKIKKENEIKKKVFLDYANYEYQSFSILSSL